VRERRIAEAMDRRLRTGDIHEPRRRRVGMRDGRFGVRALRA